MSDLEHETTSAVLDCLAPLRPVSAEPYDRSARYVLHGETPHVLHTLASREPFDVALVARPDTFVLGTPTFWRAW